MAGGGGTPGSAGTIELNVVPLVDVACLLIMFFILTSQFASANFAELQLATPKGSQSVTVLPKTHHDRLVVNVVCKSNPHDRSDHAPALSLQAKEYSIQGGLISADDPDAALIALEKKIRTEMMHSRADKTCLDFTVEVRADKRVAFSTVEPVMTATAQAVGNAKIAVKEFPIKMDLTAMSGGN
jgi:biopolymer transport protein ExbD